jgi:hypothetical protein
MGFCFAFAALAMVGTMATVWFNANASTVTDSHTLNVQATVGGVSPGPAQPETTSGSKAPQPQPNGNPIITIVAEPVGKVPMRGVSYVFDNSRPAFSGDSSVANGLVFVTIQGPVNFNGTAIANAQGKWYWKSPIDLPNGTYTAHAAVFDSYDLTRSGSAQASFIIETPAGQPQPNPGNGNNNAGNGNGGSGGNNGGNGNTNTGQNPGGTPGVPGIPTVPSEPLPPGSEKLLFGVFFNIMGNYKYTNAGDKVVGTVTLVSNGGKPIKDQEIRYTVVSPTGETIMDSTDTVSFDRKSQLIKTFYIAPKTAPGDYTITVSGIYQGVPSVASDTFRVLASAANTAGTITPPGRGPVILWVIMILLWLLFIILVYFAYRYVKHHTQEIKKAGV